MARRPGSPSSKGHGLPSQAGRSRRRAIRRLTCSSPRGTRLRRRGREIGRLGPADAVLATNIVTADRYMAVVLPARSFKKPFSERGLAPVVLSRAVGPLERQRRHAQLLALRCPISRARCRRSPLRTPGCACARRNNAIAGSAGLAHYASLSSTALASLLLWRAPIWES